MLKSLSISSIVLVKSARLDFSSGLTALTGETGAGKSAILKALSLALGGRGDPSLVRTGATKGRVEAAFEIDTLPEVLRLLEEGGIDHQEGDELIISREIPVKGSSRAFINQQMVQSSFLKRLASHLLDLVGQSANVRLTTPCYHLETIDLYGKLKKERTAYQKSYARCNELKERITQLTTNKAELLRKEARLQAELEEIMRVDPQEGEEETLFQEYTRLTHSEELSQLVHNAVETLEGEESALTRLAFCQKKLERMGQLDESTSPSQKALEGILVETQELAYTLKDYQSKLEYNPQRLEAVNARLTTLNQLQKKYGPDVAAHRKEVEREMEEVSGGEEKIAALAAELIQKEEACNTLAETLTRKRKKAGKTFQEAVTAHLRPLNLKEAQFEVVIEPTTLGSMGGDEIEFTFAPNVGEGSLSVRKCASGGELSRLLLALKTALGGLERTPTLIFDEIDTGMGGETAVLVGQKLKTIATGRQVLCITHLPQVARQADHHFAIEKEEEKGRTLTRVRKVDGDEKRVELTRMHGGEILAI